MLLVELDATLRPRQPMSNDDITDLIEIRAELGGQLLAMVQERRYHRLSLHGPRRRERNIPVSC